jgi:Ca-activated chloride channel family protein
MEYKSLEFSILGVLALILWSLDYWKILKKPELILPTGTYKKNVSLLRTVIYTIGLVGWICITIAMVGPRKALKFIPGNIEVNDIFLVLDVSRSMLVDDIKPNRLEVAKEKLREFARLRPTDRLGVIIFSEKVFTALPLTTDPELIDQILDEIRIGYLGSGTNIGDALALAVARGEASETKNKVVVLLTDGVNNVGNLTPIQAAEMARDYNIKVYTIGLGTNNNARLPVGRNAFGQTQYQRIPGGSIDTETLEKISNMTGGKSFMADSKGSLREILESIQKLEKTKIKSQSRVVYDELFFPFLLWGVLLFVFVELFRKFIIKEVL